MLNNDADEINRIKNFLENLIKESDKAEVEEKYLLEQLKKEFEIETTEEAEELYTQLINEKTELIREKELKLFKIKENLKKENLNYERN